jgi:hypothetical protein
MWRQAEVLTQDDSFYPGLALIFHLIIRISVPIICLYHDCGPIYATPRFLQCFCLWKTYVSTDSKKVSKRDTLGHFQACLFRGPDMFYGQ